MLRAFIQGGKKKKRRVIAFMAAMALMFSLSYTAITEVALATEEFFEVEEIEETSESAANVAETATTQSKSEGSVEKTSTIKYTIESTKKAEESSGESKNTSTENSATEVVNMQAQTTIPDELKEKEWFKKAYKLGVYAQYDNMPNAGFSYNSVGKLYWGEPISVILDMSKDIKGFDLTEFLRQSVAKGYTYSELENIYINYGIDDLIDAYNIGLLPEKSNAVTTFAKFSNSFRSMSLLSNGTFDMNDITEGTFNVPITVRKGVGVGGSAVSGILSAHRNKVPGHHTSYITMFDLQLGSNSDTDWITTYFNGYMQSASRQNAQYYKNIGYSYCADPGLAAPAWHKADGSVIRDPVYFGAEDCTITVTKQTDKVYVKIGIKSSRYNSPTGNQYQDIEADFYFSVPAGASGKIRLQKSLDNANYENLPEYSRQYAKYSFWRVPSEGSYEGVGEWDGEYSWVTNMVTSVDGKGRPVDWEHPDDNQYYGLVTRYETEMEVDIGWYVVFEENPGYYEDDTGNPFEVSGTFIDTEGQSGTQNQHWSKPYWFYVGEDQTVTLDASKSEIFENKVEYVSLKLQKQAANPDFSDNYDIYSDFSGAKFGFRRVEKQADGTWKPLGNVTNEMQTLEPYYYVGETNSRGVLEIPKMPKGPYQMVELVAPTAYSTSMKAYLHGDEVTETLGEGLIITGLTESNRVERMNELTIIETESVDPVHLILEKKDALNPGVISTGDATLLGAKFRFDFYTDDYLTKEQIKSGQYTPFGYIEAETKLIDGKAAITFHKDDGCITASQGMALKYISEDTVQLYGEALRPYIGQLMLPVSTMVIYETQASKGFQIAGNVMTDTSPNDPNNVYSVTDNMYVVNINKDTVDEDGLLFTDLSVLNSADPALVEEKPITGGVMVYKYDSDRYANDNKSIKPQGDGITDGTVFAIVNRSDEAVVYKGAEVAVGDEVCRITVKDGVAKTGPNDLYFGTYEIFEVIEGTHYLLNNTWSRTFSITEDSTMVDASDTGEKFDVSNKIKRGDVQLQKLDDDTLMGKAQGDGTLADAVIHIYNNSKEDVYTQINGQYDWRAKGEVAYVALTNEQGVVTLPDYALPAGTYWAIEYAPTREGYHLNPTWRVDFQIRQDGTLVDLTDQPVIEKVIRGGVQIQKWDIELNKSEAIGGKGHNGNNDTSPHLNGIVYSIVNRSKAWVYVTDSGDNPYIELLPDVNGDNLYEPGEEIMRITTHWNEDLQAYTAETRANTLPYGTYDISETGYIDRDGFFANKWYFNSDSTPKTFEVREEGVIVLEDRNGNDLVYKDYVHRGGIFFRKTASDTQLPLQTLWVLENQTTLERHVLLTDANGEYCTEEPIGYAHSINTNANDQLLARIDAGEQIPIADAVQCGIWFGLGEDGTMAPVNDALSALPKGAYIMTEVPTDTNEGYMMRTIPFVIERPMSYRGSKGPIAADADDKMYFDGIKDLSNIQNDPTIVATLSTEARDFVTGTNIGTTSEGITKIIDTVTYDGVIGDRRYVVKGKLMDGVTGNPIRDGKGNEITAQTEFTASGKTGSVDVTFEVESSIVEGKKVVVFQEMFYEVDTKIGEHMDLTDEKQTVFYPSVETSALSEATQEHMAPSVGTIKLVDTVTYTNLKPGETYRLKGTLMDAATSDKALDVNGKEIVSEVEFTPDASDGTVDVIFEFDGSSLAGAKTVVFESLYYQDFEVATHADFEDENQTIYFPEVKTEANVPETGTNVGVVKEELEIVDTVSYKNLVVGKEYTLNGTLMRKDTGEALLDETGKPITATHTFIADKSEGITEIKFVVDTSLLKGTELVVFESLVYEGIEIAVHTDINDETQTVYFPEIGTSAVFEGTEEQLGPISETVTIVDTVTYKGLKPNIEYKVVGRLMNKETEEALQFEDKDIVAEVVFTPETPDGTVEVIFTINAVEYAGKQFVVFEKLYINDVEITNHEDIEDEGQTVEFTVPKIGTTAVSKATGEAVAELSEEAVIVDTVAYENLADGVTYHIKGVLMDKDTNAPLLDVNGNMIVGEAEFVADSEIGVADVEFKLDTTKLPGKSIVVFEELYLSSHLIAEHKDIADEKQTVVVMDNPPVGTGTDIYNGKLIILGGLGVMLVGLLVYKHKTNKKKA